MWNSLIDKFSLIYTITPPEEKDDIVVPFSYRINRSYEDSLGGQRDIYFLRKVFTPVFFLEPEEVLQNDNTFSRLHWDETDLVTYIRGTVGIPAGGDESIHQVFQYLCDLPPESLPSFYYTMLTYDYPVEVNSVQGPIAFHQALTRPNLVFNFLTMLLLPQLKEILYVLCIVSLCLLRNTPQADFDINGFQINRIRYNLQAKIARRLERLQRKKDQQLYVGRQLEELELFLEYMKYLRKKYAKQSRKHGRLIKRRQKRIERRNARLEEKRRLLEKQQREQEEQRRQAEKQRKSGKKKQTEPGEQRKRKKTTARKKNKKL